MILSRWRILRSIVTNCRKYNKRKMSSITADVSNNRFAWIDLEMTGLDVSRDQILEIACVVTTPNLTVIKKGINIIINQSDDVLTSMNEWCIKQHGKSGLTNACRESKITLQQAEQQTYEYIKSCSGTNGINYLAGNSVHADMVFLKKYMPSVPSLLHYRIIDVSTIKTLFEHWYTGPCSGFKKKMTHRGMEDIEESIAELKFYKSNFFNLGVEGE